MYVAYAPSPFPRRWAVTRARFGTQDPVLCAAAHEKGVSMSEHHHDCCPHEVSSEQTEETYPFTGKKLIRPPVPWGRAVLWVLLSLAGCGLLAATLQWVFARFAWLDAMSGAGRFVLLYALLILLWLCITARQVLIFFIRVYQRYAPYDVRCMCVYVPNCSEYMILAVEKYGLIRGVTMGLRRLRHCGETDGGEDYP